MNFDKLFTWIVSIVIGCAAVGKVDTLQRWIWTAQAKVISESKTSNWGSPRFFRIVDSQIKLKREAHALLRTTAAAGSRGAKLCEPLCWVETYPALWRKPRFDLAELARLRWIKGLTHSEIGPRLISC